MYQKILSGEYKVPSHLSEDAKDILANILNVDPAKRFRVDDIRKHNWWKKSKNQVNFSHGIIVGYHRIPVDLDILSKLSQWNFDLDFTKKCIEANRHNDATTTYYLMLKKHIRQGGTSKTYLGQKEFDPSLIEPIKKVFQNTLAENSSWDNQEKNKKSLSQPGFPRGSYALSNHNSLDRKGKRDNSLRKNSFIKFYTPHNSVTNTIQSRKERTISFSNTNSKRNTSRVNNNTISRKYRETYGTSLMSKSKDQDSSRKRSLRKYELSGIQEKTFVSQVNPYARPNKKMKNVGRIGIDRGFEDLKTIDASGRKPYMNRRFLHY